MMLNNTYIKILAGLLLFAGVSAAQSTRSLINEGVDHYNGKKYSDSEVNFKKGIETDPKNFAGHFNLGDAFYKQERYDEAITTYQKAFSLAKTNDEKAKVFHNIGNSLLKGDKLQESVEAYKKALKLNPQDAETKYNLSYALNKLKNQNNQQQNKNNQNQQNKQNQDKSGQDKNQDKNKQDQQNKDQQNQQQQQNQQNEQSKQDNTKQKEQKISKQEAERILQALKNNEQDMQKKLRKQKGVPVKTDKDW